MKHEIVIEVEDLGPEVGHVENLVEFVNSLLDCHDVRTWVTVRDGKTQMVRVDGRYDWDD